VIPFPVRYVCIDLGDKRTGLASGDTQTWLVTPGDVLEVPVTHDSGRAILDALSRAVRELGGAALVVGLPINMDDSEGPRAKKVRLLAEKIASATGLPLHFQDERLSSVQADWQMSRSGMTRGQKKSRRDALAAASILTDFFAGLRDAEAAKSRRIDAPNTGG